MPKTESVFRSRFCQLSLAFGAFCAYKSAGKQKAVSSQSFLRDEGIFIVIKLIFVAKIDFFYNKQILPFEGATDINRRKVSFPPAQISSHQGG